MWPSLYTEHTFISTLPVVGGRLRQADVGEHAAGELVRHLVERRGAKVVRRDERKDGRASVGGTVEVADMDFAERSFAHAEHQRTLLLKANVGGALDQM